MCHSRSTALPGPDVAMRAPGSLRDLGTFVARRRITPCYEFDHASLSPVLTMALGLDLPVMLLLNPFRRRVRDLGQATAETKLEALEDAAPERYAPGGGQLPRA
jgi:hypothetical protein